VIVFLTFLVILDQLTKLAAESFLQTQINTGSALSLAVASLAFIILLADLIKKRQIGMAETLILSGGLSNIIDRGVKYGVVDWINFYGLWFNLADVYITLGVTLWILKSYLKTTN